MPIEPLSIMYLGIGVLFAVFMCVAVQTIVEQTAKLFVRKKKIPSTCSGPSLTLSKPTSMRLKPNLRW